MDTPRQKAGPLKKKKKLSVENSGVFKRRKEGIKKKAVELSVLCDVPVCLLIQAPNGELEIWPENPDSFRASMKKLKAKSKGKTHDQELCFHPSEKPKMKYEMGFEKKEVFSGVNGKEFSDSHGGNNWGHMNAFGFQETGETGDYANGQTSFEGKENLYDEMISGIENPDFLFGLNPSFPHHDVLPVEFSEIYGLPPLQDLHPLLDHGWVESQGDIAGTSGRIDFSPYGDIRNITASEGFASSSAYNADLTFMDDSIWQFY